jgi:hypothetical protein
MFWCEIRSIIGFIHRLVKGDFFIHQAMDGILVKSESYMVASAFY